MPSSYTLGKYFETFVQTQLASERYNNAIELRPLLALDPAVELLALEAEQQGFGFMRRLAAEWQSGDNRFDRPGECLLAAHYDSRLIGVGGLNRDPYVQGDGIGRLRHLYVHASARWLGVGSQLVAPILKQARGSFRVVRLRATTAEAAAFYGRLGFVSTSEEAASHVMVLDRGITGDNDAATPFVSRSKTAQNRTERR